MRIVKCLCMSLETQVSVFQAQVWRPVPVSVIMLSRPAVYSPLTLCFTNWQSMICVGTGQPAGPARHLQQILVPQVARKVAGGPVEKWCHGARC